MKTTKLSSGRKIKVVELYAGSCTLTQVAEEKLSMDSLSTDNHQYGKVKLVGDILDPKVLRAIVKHRPDIIWASPPCTSYSVAGFNKRHFHKVGQEYVPNTSVAGMGIALALRVFEVIRAVKKAHGYIPVWFMENPRGLLRKMKFMEQSPIRHTVTYCRYGSSSMKPTDVFTNCKTWTPRTMCKRGGWGKKVIDGVTWCLDRNGNPCHIEAKRGSRTGTQGLDNAHERAKLPRALCKEVLKAARQRVWEKEILRK